MVTLIMASSPCRAASSQDSQKGIQVSAQASTTPKIPECMPGTPPRWFFTSKVLRDENPSLKSGIDLEKELYYRQQAAGFIHELGMKLQLSHLVMNVAMVYMHRFYVFHSFRRFPRNDVAAACIFLAAKVEEMPRKLEYIVKVSYALQHREDPTLDVKSNKYNEEAQRIVIYENILLQTLGFDLTVAVPNQFVVKCIQMVKAPRELAQAAYHFTNDCLHLTTLCLRYRPAVVACACIFLACSWAKWEIPTSHEGKPWYYYVDSDVTKEVLEALAEEIVNVYQKCPDRLKIKRYMAGKREEGGASTSTDGGAGEELQESALYNSITASIAAAGRPAAASASKLKIEVELTNAQKTDEVAAVEISGSSKPNSMVGHESTATHLSAEKKQKPETAKLDMKSYMDRMKERRPEQQAIDAADSPSKTARKSFIPDISSSRKMEDSKRQEIRSGDRHSRHRGSSSQEADIRMHSQRLPSANSGSHHHDQRSSGGAMKSDYGRHHADVTGDESFDSRKRHNEANDHDGRERKIVKTDFGNGGGHGSSRFAKDSSKGGSSHGGDPKMAVSVVPKSGPESVAAMNGMPLDESREKQMKRPDGDDRSPQSVVTQAHPDDKSTSTRPLNDDILRQATQKADQLMRQQQLAKFKSFDPKMAASSAIISGKESREKNSISGQDNPSDVQPPLPPLPPLPPDNPPPLPALPPPPPPS